MASSVAKGFGRLAPLYDHMAALVYGRAIRRAQTHFLPTVQPTQALVLGGGTGWIMQEMRKAWPQAHLTYIDIAPRMVSKATAKLGSDPNAHFICGRIQDLPPHQQFDTILTPFIFDLFQGPALTDIMTTTLSHLSPLGTWIMTDFRKVPAGPMRYISRALLWLMYRFFRLTCHIQATDLPDLEAHARSLGFHLQAHHHTYQGMIRTTRWLRNPIPNTYP